MRLSVSNIAWLADQREAAHALMAEMGVTGLEIAPGLTFPGEADPFEPSAEAVADFRGSLERHGLTLVSMQSLLFGVSGAQLFGAAGEREAFEAGLDRAIALAGRLGVPNLVMGSPGNRSIPNGMDRSEAETLAVETFHRLGEAAARADCVLALEPNPAGYGTNFLNTFDEAWRFAARVDHPAITANFDIGALSMNGETEAATSALPEAIRHVSHVHVSEPLLAPAPSDAMSLASVLARLDAVGYDAAVSIEMRAGDAPLDQLATSIRACQDAFVHAGLPKDKAA